MSYEVDILAVGEDSKSGDAIALRFGNFLQNTLDQYVVVIDGGFASSGQKLVQWVKKFYGTNYIDLVISTHPDADHINGLRAILDELKVGELWMHTPWNISEDVKALAEYRGLDSIINPTKLKKSLEAAFDLEKFATQKGVKIVEPFEGLSAFNGTIQVFGPNLDYYYELVSQFEDTGGGLSLESLLGKVKTFISESWHEDGLAEPEGNAVSPRNNSSVITLINLGNHFLFVGDAGVPALTKAADYADSIGYDLATNVHYHHVPHHGSKRNLGPAILGRIIGPILPEGQKNHKHAFISACPESNKHPSKRVSNALIRRGVTVSATCGNDHCFKSSDVPLRPGWGPITPLEFESSYNED